MHENSQQPLSSARDAQSSERRRSGEQSHAETLFYLRHVETRAPLVFRLRDGEVLRGSLAWYDRGCLRVDVGPGAHRIVQKSAILLIEDAPPQAS